MLGTTAVTTIKFDATTVNCNRVTSARPAPVKGVKFPNFQLDPHVIEYVLKGFCVINKAPVCPD
jgi:hypothetical protein